MNALHGYVTAALAIAVLAAGVLGYRIGHRHAETAGALVMAKQMIEIERAAGEQKDRVRELETQLATAAEDVSAAYEEGKRDAEATGAAVAADLRAGALRLQRRWAGCETQRLSEATAASLELDAAARDREESAGRIVRAAAQCDAQVRGLQQLVLSERELMNKRQGSSQR